MYPCKRGGRDVYYGLDGVKGEEDWTDDMETLEATEGKIGDWGCA